MTSRRPENAWPRGLNAGDAAVYIGVSERLFHTMVADGRMPAPKRVGSRTIWDRFALDRAFAALPDGTEAPEDSIWDKVTA